MDLPEPTTGGAPKKQRSRGARLSKAEREARREARQAAATDDLQHGEAFEARRAALLGHAAVGDWDRAAEFTHLVPDGLATDEHHRRSYGRPGHRSTWVYRLCSASC